MAFHVCRKIFLALISSSLYWVSFSLASHADTIKFLSWNVSNYVPSAGYSYRDEIGTWRTDTDLLAIRKILASGYDAILLQEAVSDLAVRSTVGPSYSIFATEEYRRLVSAPPQLEQLVQPFVAVLETADLRVTNTESWRLDNAVSGAHLTRDILYFELAWLQHRVGVVHAHLKSGCPITVISTRLECQLMTEQFQKIEAVVEKRVDAVDALLVIGDFNRELMNPRLLQWRNEHVPWAKNIIPIPPCKLRPSINPIDFVLVAKIANGLKFDRLTVDLGDVELLLSQRISDHCPFAFQLSG